MKQLTVNEMILATLRTKTDKTPKYKKVLEALGYKLNNSHDWSTYDYWGIDAADGTVLVISQSYGKQRRLYKTCRSVNVKFENLNKVDFENLLKTNRPRPASPFSTYNCIHVYTEFGSKRIYDYYRLKESMRTTHGILTSIEKEKKLEADLAKTTRRIDYYNNQLEQDTEKYQKLFNRN